MYIHIFYVLQKHHGNREEMGSPCNKISIATQHGFECKQALRANMIVSTGGFASTGCLHLLFFSALQLFIRGRRGIIFNGSIRVCIICLCVRLADMFTRMALIPHYHARQECYETSSSRSPHDVVRNNRCTARTRPVIM